MSMRLDTRQVGDVTVIDILGRIDASAGSGKYRTLGDIVRDLARNGAPNIVLNLAFVSYIDSSGVGELVAAVNAAQAAGGDLKVINPNGIVQQVLKLTRLVPAVIDVQPDEASAVAALSDDAGLAAGQNE